LSKPGWRSSGLRPVRAERLGQAEKKRLGPKTEVELLNKFVFADAFFWTSIALNTR